MAIVGWIEPQRAVASQVASPRRTLAVNLAAVADFDNEDDQSIIVQLAEDAIVADSVAPETSERRPL